MASQKIVFLQALIIAIIVFNIGIYMGYKLESVRIDKIDDWYLQSELELLDQRVQGDAFDVVNLDCDSLVKENIDFADRIFKDALVIQRYEEANQMNEDIISLHKKYDLLRTLFWVNSIKIKQKCNSDYHNLVYFYNFNDLSVDTKSKQDFFSNLLFQIKQEKGDNVMLIPIAANNDIPSISLLLKKYGIYRFPTILIDEKERITELETKQDILKYLD